MYRCAVRCGRGGGAVPYARVEGRRYRESGGCLVTEDRALGSGLGGDWAVQSLGEAGTGVWVWGMGLL